MDKYEIFKEIDELFEKAVNLSVDDCNWIISRVEAIIEDIK